MLAIGHKLIVPLFNNQTGPCVNLEVTDISATGETSKTMLM